MRFLRGTRTFRQSMDLAHHFGIAGSLARPYPFVWSRHYSPTRRKYHADDTAAACSQGIAGPSGRSARTETGSARSYARQIAPSTGVVTTDQITFGLNPLGAIPAGFVDGTEYRSTTQGRQKTHCSSLRRRSSMVTLGSSGRRGVLPRYAAETLAA